MDITKCIKHIVGGLAISDSTHHSPASVGKDATRAIVNPLNKHLDHMSKYKKATYDSSIQAHSVIVH